MLVKLRHQRLLNLLGGLPGMFAHLNARISGFGWFVRRGGNASKMMWPRRRQSVVQDQSEERGSILILRLHAQLKPI